MPIDVGFAAIVESGSSSDAANCWSDRVRISTKRVGSGERTCAENVLKRLLVHAGAFNLGLWMRTLFGVGTTRSLQGRAAALDALLSALWTVIADTMTATWSPRRGHTRPDRPSFGFVVGASVQ